MVGCDQLVMMMVVVVVVVGCDQLIFSLPENEPVREFATYVPSHGRRKPGRQQTLFTNYIHCLLGDPDSLINDNQLWEMAQDCHRWKKLVFHCSAAER